MAKLRRLLWLLYKRLRTGIGVTLGFVMIYGAYTRTLFTDPWTLLPIALGFWFIHIHGDLFNDYYDYEEDIRNGRDEKWTTSGLVGRQNVLYASIVFALAGLAALALTNVYVLLIGVAFAFTSILYSHPVLRVKRFELRGYILIALPVFLFPLVWDSAFARPFSVQDMLLGLFFGFNYIYVCCQKDSTDLHDATNLFIKRRWRIASLICITFGVFAIGFFLTAITSLPLFVVWVQNTVSKFFNLRAIYTRSVTRRLRSRVILSEFMTPYLYVGGALLWL